MQHNPDPNSQYRPASSPSDIPEDRSDYASELKGGLPMRKRRYSPFDRIGSRQWEPQQGQMPKGYA